MEFESPVDLNDSQTSTALTIVGRMFESPVDLNDSQTLQLWECYPM